MNIISKFKQIIFSLIITFVLLVIIFWKIDFSQLIRLIISFNVKDLFFIIIIYFLSLILRGLRWKYLIRNNTNLSLISLSEIFTVGSALNSYLPLRVGDLWRAYYLNKESENLNINNSNNKQDNKFYIGKTKALASIVLERILDGVSIVLILIFASLIFYSNSDILKLIYISGILFFGALFFILLIYNFNIIDKIFNYVYRFIKRNKHIKLLEKIQEVTKNFIEGLSCISSIKNLIITIVLSFSIWYCEVCCVYILLKSFNLDIGISACLFIISFIALSTIIPSTSIFIGPYQLAVIWALSIYNISKTTSLAIAFVYQGIIMLILTVIFIIFLLRHNFKLDNLKNLLERS